MMVLPEPVASVSRTRGGFAVLPAADDLLEGGADGGILVVAGLCDQAGLSAWNSMAASGLVIGRCRCPWRSGRSDLVRRKVGKRKRAALQAGEAVELAVAMAVGGENVLDVEALAIGIALWPAACP